MFTSTPSFQQARFAERCQKVPLDGNERLADDRLPSDQDKVDWHYEVLLMQTETFAEQTTCTVPYYGIPQPAGRNYPQPRIRGGSQTLPIRNQASRGKSFPLLPDAREIPPLLDPRRAPEPQALWHFAAHG